MRKLFLLFFILFGAFSANAQLKFGAGGGINMSSLRGDIDNPKSLTGFNGGFMLEVKAPAVVGVELDVLYSTKGATYEISNPITSGDFTLNLTYIDFPLMVKLYSAKIMSLQLGAQYSFLMAADFEGTDVKDQLKGTDLAAVVGLGIDISKFHFSTRYAYGLTTIDDNGADVKNGMLTITAGFWIKN